VSKKQAEPEFTYIRHVAGVPCLGLQSCVECGLTLVDAQYMVVNGGGALPMWQPGEVFQCGNFWCTALKKGAHIINCTEPT
jgi:hypothetical protein